MGGQANTLAGLSADRKEKKSRSATHPDSAKNLVACATLGTITLRLGLIHLDGATVELS